MQTPREPGADGSNTFDLVSSQLDRLHELLSAESDEEGEPAAPQTPTRGQAEELPRVSSSEDITNRLKEALQTLDRLDEAVDAFSMEPFAESESESDRETSFQSQPGSAERAREAPERREVEAAPPGGIIMDGWLETKNVEHASQQKVNFKKKWDKRYCMLTTEVISDAPVFVLACFKTQKAYQKKQDPEVMVELGRAAVALDIANSSAGSIVISVRTTKDELLYLRSTVSFVAQGWVTGMRGLQFAGLLGWSERGLCAWLRAGGLSEETLTMLQAFNLDGLRLAKLGSIEQKQDEATKHLQRNLGLSEGESEAIVRQLGELQTAEVVAWLDDKARELDGLYPRITDAVKFCASQQKVEEAKGKADEVDGKATDRAARAQQQAERDGVQQAEKAARDGARVAHKAKRDAAAVRVQQVWRGVLVRQQLSVLMESLGYFDTGELDEKAFRSEWDRQNRTRAGQEHWSAEDVAATKIAAAYRGYTRRMSYMMLRVEKHLAAVDIQAAWRGKAVRLVHDLEVDGKSQAILDRSLIRRRVRLLWQHFFAWQQLVKRVRQVSAMSHRSTDRRDAARVGNIFMGWMDVVATRVFYTKLVTKARSQAQRRIGARALAEWHGATIKQTAEQKEQKAAALIRRALNSRDPTLVEEAIQMANSFPSLHSQVDDCRHLLTELVVEFVVGALKSADMAVVTKAISLARKYSMGPELEQLQAWKDTLAEVKTLIVRADKTGDLKSIERAIVAAQAYACFSKQVQALRQMKSLLADVHSLLNQALERQDPEDVNMAIKVASRFDSIRQSEKYKRLVELKKSIEMEQRRVRSGNTAARNAGAKKRKSPRATAKKRAPFDEDVPPRSARHDAGKRTPSNAASNGHSTPGSSPSSPDSDPERTSPTDGAPTPPPSLRPEVAEMISHCAEWVAQHGPSFEKTLRAKNASNPAFSFLQQPSSLEAKYYRQCLDHERALSIVKMSKQSAPKRGGPSRVRQGQGRNGTREEAIKHEGEQRTGLSPIPRPRSTGPRLVFIWDMDETLIVFQSLVSGSYMNARRMSPERHTIGKNLGLQMMKLILWPLDNAMFFEQIEQVDKHHVDCLEKFDDHADLRRYDYNSDRFFVQDGRGGRATCDLRKLAYR